ncbi:MAG: hypothetical protein ABFS17_10800 [Chloroflexota bacterium]
MRSPSENILYYERLSSNRTMALFAALTILFGGLALWRVSAVCLDGLATALIIICVFFLFYVINYRTLIIQLTTEELKLKFGIFSWTVPTDNIADCQLDHISGFMRYGGAGIHFMMIEKRYRASFNFLDHPRVVIAFKNRVGPVRDISFSTRQPEELIRLIRETATGQASRPG